MRAGEARHLFTLQRPEPTASTGFVDVRIVNGSLRLLSGAEVLRFGAVTSSAQQVIEIRFATDVTAAWRVYEEATDRTFHVVYVGDPDDRRRRLWVFVSQEQ